MLTAFLLAASSPCVGEEVSVSEWPDEGALLDIAKVVESRHFRAVNWEAVTAKVREAGRMVAGVDPARYEGCLAANKDLGRGYGNFASTLKEILNCIDLAGRRGQERDAIMEALANAIVQPLDSDSAVLGPKWVRELRVLAKRLHPVNPEQHLDAAGVGIAMKDAANGKEIVSTTIASPASEAGVVEGDLLVEIDGQPVANLSLEDAAAALRGKASSTVTLKVQPKSGSLQTLVLTRKLFAELHLGFSYVRRVGPALIITFSEFENNTPSNLEEIWRRFGKGAEALVFDIRDNVGGSLEAVSATVDLLLSKGIIGTLKRRDGVDVEIYRANRYAIARDVPIAVVTGPQTAAGAEIFAAALHDNNRGKLIGERTFGRGSIQSLFLIGEDVALKLTTGEMIRPTGEPFNKNGITPDCLVAVDSKTIIEQAIRLAHLRTAACPVQGN